METCGEVLVINIKKEDMDGKLMLHVVARALYASYICGAR